MDSKLPFLLQESFSCFSLLGLEVIHELHKGYSEWENENRPKPKSRNVCKLLLTALTLPVPPLVLRPIPFPVGCLQGLGHQLQLPARAPSPHPSQACRLLMTPMAPSKLRALLDTILPRPSRFLVGSSFFHCEFTKRYSLKYSRNTQRWFSNPKRLVTIAPVIVTTYFLYLS